MKRFDGVLILADMDGTLLDPSGAIAECDRLAIDRFIDGGGMFGVATGRARRSVELFLPELHTSAPSIVHNGALVTDLRTGEDVRTLWLGDVGAHIVEDVLEMFPQVGIEICLPDDQFVARGNFFSERHHKNIGLEMKLRSYKDVPQPWLKLNLTADHEVLLDAREHILSRYRKEIFAQFSLPHYYEIMAKGASKGDSAMWLRDRLGVRPENFYTIGDGTNDLELVKASGINSCAPENARDIIKDAAAHILPDNANGAMATMIDMLDKKY